MLKVFSCCYSESFIKKKKLFSARNIVNSLLDVYPVEIAPYGKHVSLIGRVPFFCYFIKEKSLHMQMTVISPHIIVWVMLNEITCFISFMSLDFTVLFLLQYFYAFSCICSVILYMTIELK